MMKILFIEPFYTSSHKIWLDGWVSHSGHEITIYTMPGRHWKWRMHGAAVTMAHQLNNDNTPYDIIMVSDMLDLTCFKSLLLSHQSTLFGIYFHENQLTYPWSPTDRDVPLQRDRTYAWINYTSALVADFCWFNSDYHRNSFLKSLPQFLKAFPDHVHLETITQIANKSKTMYLGLDLDKKLSLPVQTNQESPIILWNHRWEYDKNPEGFFNICRQLMEKNIDFQLIVCGEKYKNYPSIFDEAKTWFKDRILHWGYAISPSDYLTLLKKANLILVTSYQDFFGGSVVEAIAAGCVPILPNRLAYPEHLPEQYYSNCLYHNTKEVIDIFIQKKWIKTLREINELKKYVKKYHWSEIALHYDAELSQLIQL